MDGVKGPSKAGRLSQMIMRTGGEVSLVTYYK